MTEKKGPVHMKYDTSEEMIKFTLIKVMLSRACPTGEFPTKVTGKDCLGRKVDYAYCPICKAETESRNERRKEAGLKPVVFTPPTYNKVGDIVYHMHETHKVDFDTIMVWAADPTPDNLTTVLILAGIEGASSNARNT